MTLIEGARLGPYTIMSALGRGGMGEVFRARDTRLNRDVAIKVLPELFAGDPDRLARFEREAQVLASLNHPNIAQVHGLEESSGTRALVMELVEGKTLDEVIKSAGGRALPVADVLPLARQIAEALDVAHEKGIVHRDLKPANVVVTADGVVKVLDFGLAKALAPADGMPSDVMNSPTFTGRVTEVGVVLGTAAYMAPEQARGLAVDRRADIWAFGVVLYEMLTGRHAFDGDTATDIVAAVITRDPDWSRLPAALPEPLTRVLRRCLEKDPKRRMRDIGDARAELDTASASFAPKQETSAPAMLPARRSRPWALPVGLAVALLAGAAIGRQLLAPAPPATGPVRFDIVMPERARAVMAPDGTRIALTSSKGLLVRDLASLEMRQLAGTEGAENPFWSDDSTTLVYGAKGKLWRVVAAGGSPSLISGLPNNAWDQDAGGAFTADGGIIFTNGSSPLMRVPAAGGDPTTLIAVNPAEDLHFHHASGLPEHRGILFVTHRKPGPDTIELAVGAERRRIVRFEGSALSYPVYSPTGHILFTRVPANAGLWAVPFSLSKLEVTGEPFLVDANAAAATISTTSRLAYVPASGIAPSRFTWFDRNGRSTGRVEDLRVITGGVALSPDASLVAFTEQIDDKVDVWTLTFKTGERKRLTADGYARSISWLPDGRSIVYVSAPPNAPTAIKRVATDGSGVLEELGAGRDAVVSSDGRTVFYQRDFDLFYRPLGGGAEVAFLKGPGRQLLPQLSPDGRFVLYMEQEPNTLERFLHVRPFPSGGEPTALGLSGFAYRWSRDGKRLYFTKDADVFEVDVQTTPRFRVGIPRKLYSAKPLGTSGFYPGFDVSADGQRFLTLQSESEASTQRVVVVLDFTPVK